MVAPPKYGDLAAIIGWVKVTPVAFYAGETIQIEVGVRNPTTKPIIMGFTSGCMLSYAVKNSSDAYVAPGFLCTLDAPTLELAPGKTLAAQFSWDGTTYAGMPLPPGEYRVDSDGFLCPSTTPVTIQILAPQRRAPAVIEPRLSGSRPAASSPRPRIYRCRVECRAGDAPIRPTKASAQIDLSNSR